MKASENRLNDFLSASKTCYIIPIYQRNYDWQDYQCSQLYTDIINVADNEEHPSHFVGSIVYMHDGLYTDASVKELIVIDGQQRLTTITLLYVALLHFAEDNNMPEEADELRETYLINRHAKGRKEKLWQTVENDEIYQRLIHRKSEEGERFSRMRENYSYFRELIRDEEVFRQVLRGLNKLSFVEISLERGKDDPQRIFESLNSTGLALSQADLIRNYVLMGHDRQQQEQLYDTYWSEIERNARLDEDRTNLVSDFVRDYLTFKNKRIPRKSKVYEVFKQRYPQRGYEAVVKLLVELKNFSGYYGRLHNPAREPDLDVRQQLLYFKQLETTTSYPFLLQVFRDYDEGVISKAEFIEVMELTQRYIWRRFLANLNTSALNKVFMRLYEDIRLDDYVDSLKASLVRQKGTQRLPKDAEVMTALRERDFYNIRTKNRSYFLERLENYNNRERVSFDRLTVEHIFPQTPHAQWKRELTAEDYEYFQNNHLHQLGNLTLSGNNGALSNKPFQKKKEMNHKGGEQGYAYSRLWLNRGLLKLDTWTISDFKKRHQELIKRTFEIWPYPDVEVSVAADKAEELTIFEIDDPTGYQIEYAYLGEDRIEPKSVKEFYVHILRQLFAKDPSPLMRPDVAGTILLMRNDPDAKAGEDLGRGYSVDAANSSWVKFKRLETVLTAYDMEEAVRVKFKE